MLPRICLLLLLLTASFGASAKKWYMPIEAIASQAEYIVVGDIVAVQDSTYRFRVAEYVKGKGDQILVVQQFKEWTCDVRYAKPAPGQHLVLFLQKHNAALELINGSSGELPIRNNRVTLEHDTYAYQAGQPFVPYSMDVHEFTTGIQLLVRCFNIRLDLTSSSPRSAVQLGSSKEVDAFRSASPFTGWLYERIQTRYTIAKR